jgi:hypothetical protein
MPQGIYHDFDCVKESHPKFVPTKHQIDTVDYFYKSKYKGLLLYHELGCLAPNTPVLLWGGSTKIAKEVKNGDKLIGDDGTSRTVLEIVKGTADMYKICQLNGDDYTVNGNHILSLYFSGNACISWIEKTQHWKLMWFDKKQLRIRYKTKSCKLIPKDDGYNFIIQFRDSIMMDDKIDIKVTDYLKLPISLKAKLKGYRCKEVQWDEQKVNLDPYILGLWLGNGDGDVNVTFLQKLRSYNLVNNKHIPIEYIINSRDIRLKVLAGIIDTDGYMYCNCIQIQISQKNKVLSDQICYLSRSLGFYCTQIEMEKSSMYNGERKTGIYNIMTISGNGIEDIPTKNTHIKLNTKKQINDMLVTEISAVIPIGKGEYYGWKLDGNRRFLLGDFTVTHNSGKTCTSILAADKLLRHKKIKKVYILSPGSLRKGWLNEYCDVCGLKPKYLRKYFGFITYNYEVWKRLPNFDNSLVIIDEVHNLINGVKNFSKNSTVIYESLAKSNCKILALSGTPIFHNVFEWPLLGNLLKPGTFPNIIRNKKIDPEAFLSLFKTLDDGTLTPIIPTLMKRKLEGIVSYFPGAGSENYPEVIHVKPIQMVMSLPQEKNYWARVITERKILATFTGESLKRSDPTRYSELKRLKVVARKNILSRSASNFYYDEYLKNTDLLTSQDDDGWLYPGVFNNRQLFTKYSAKFAAFLININLHNKQKHVVFTFFKEKAGVVLLHNIFKMCGVKSAIFSGDLDDVKRGRLLKRFNSEENRYGDNIRVLLVTEAGAEGITILEARHMHILESSTRENIIQQAIGRVVRYKSHSKLPKSEQNVKVWRYWSIASKNPVNIEINVNDQIVVEKIINKETIDEILYYKGQKNLKRVGSFLHLLQEVSVTEKK